MNVISQFPKLTGCLHLVIDNVKIPVAANARPREHAGCNQHGSTTLLLSASFGCFTLRFMKHMCIY